jgi:hypothetical protein
MHSTGLIVGRPGHAVFLRCIGYLSIFGTRRSISYLTCTISFGSKNSLSRNFGSPSDD